MQWTDEIVLFVSKLEIKRVEKAGKKSQVFCFFLNWNKFSTHLHPEFFVELSSHSFYLWNSSLFSDLYPAPTHKPAVKSSIFFL